MSNQLTNFFLHFAGQRIDIIVMSGCTVSSGTHVLTLASREKDLLVSSHLQRIPTTNTVEADVLDAATRVLDNEAQKLCCSMAFE